VKSDFSMKTKDSITLPSSVVMRNPSGAIRMCALSVNEMQRRSWRSWRADDEMAVKRWKSVAMMDHRLLAGGSVDAGVRNVREV
jgi:hypothetical protein